MAHDPLEHVLDNSEWTIFDRMFGGVQIPLPAFDLFGHRFQVTKFMIMELIVAALLRVIFIPLSRWAGRGGAPKGWFWNAFEGMLTFVRDEIARPNLGEHDADRYVPFLWTTFFFILFCNLLGMVPLMGSPTASAWMTAGLAVFSLLLMHGAAIVKMGPLHYVKSLWPPLEIVPYPEKPTPVSLALWAGAFVFGLVISAMVFVIEFAGTFIKSGVLAIRLFANMFAGHTVLAMILLLLVAAGESSGVFSWSFGIASVTSVLGVVALSLLELFVAFLQAYVFVFLTSLFMGMALHPSH
jgi:F-type H+-transporting ATPase subunit a